MINKSKLMSNNCKKKRRYMIFRLGSERTELVTIKEYLLSKEAIVNSEGL
jgi:hypothetical protein